MTTHTCLSYTTKLSTSKVKNVLLQCWHKHLQNKRHKSNPPPSNRAKYEWGSGLMGLSRVIFRSCFSPFIYIKRRYVYKEGGGGYEELVLRYAVLLLTRWWKLPDQFRSSGLLGKAIHRGYQTFGGVYWVIGEIKELFIFIYFFLVW